MVTSEGAGTLSRNYCERFAASIRLRDRRNRRPMNLVLLVLGVVLTQVAFVTLVRKVHDRSLQQALSRWFVR
jgi:hypothetical protein